MSEPSAVVPRFQIVHGMSGRMRLRPRAPERCRKTVRAIVRAIESLPEVRRVELGGHTLSILIHYDPSCRDFGRRLTECGENNGAFTLRSRPRTPSAASGFIVSMGLPTLSLAIAFTGSPLLAGGMLLAAWNALPIFRRAASALFRERRLNIDFLDSLALSLVYAQGLYVTGAFMVWLIEFGDYVRDLTAARFTRSIRELLAYQQHLVWVVREGSQVEIPAGTVRLGETVRITRGCLIAVDGRVLAGTASVDERSITGESLSVTRRIGDAVFAGTMLTDGSLDIRAERTGDDTVAAEIVRLVETAPVGETRIQNHAEKFADKLVLPSLAGSTALYLASGDTRRFASMVTVDFGTGIRVAAPTAILASIAKAARQGVVIKSGSALEKLARADVILFDKTGTLTAGEPQIDEPIAFGSLRPSRLIELAAALEIGLHHPVAGAIVKAAHERELKVPKAVQARYEIGMGVAGKVGRHRVLLGSVRFLEQEGVDCGAASDRVATETAGGRSCLFLSVDRILQGVLPFADRLRPESGAVVRALRQRGIKTIEMMTGDNRLVARAVSAELGLDAVHAEVSPSDKLTIIQQYREQGRTVAMVGDGINDSPALSHADVGIAVRNSADIAQASASVVLVEPSLLKLLTAIDISRDALRLVRQNYAITAGLNAVALALAIPPGWSSPFLTTVISNGSALIASANAVRPLFDRSESGHPFGAESGNYPRHA